MCVQWYLTVGSTDKMDETFKTKLIDLVLNDNDVLLCCGLASQMEGDKAADTCLAMIVKMWVTIRGFFFAKTSSRSTNRKQRRKPKRPNHYAALCRLDYVYNICIHINYLHCTLT